MKKLKLFRWLLPLIYIAALAVLMIANVSGAGHTPPAFQFLIYVINAPCYVVDLFLPRGWIPNVFLGLIICIVFGTTIWAGIGYVVDRVLQRHRHKPQEQR
jgi:hypothetical protein